MNSKENGDQRTLLTLWRFKRLMGRLLLLMLGLVVLGAIGLKRHAAGWAVQTVFAGAALTALGMLLAPLVLAWQSRSLDDLDPPKAP